MNEKNEQEKFLTLYKNLPEEMKEFLFSDYLTKTVEKICKDNNIKNVMDLSTIIGELLVGLLPLENFKKSLEKMPEMSDKINSVYDDVLEKILSRTKNNFNLVHPPKKKSENNKRPSIDTYRESTK